MLGQTLFCAALKILTLFILVLPGLIAKALGPTEVTEDNAYPLLVTRLLPPGIKGLMALMSSLSSVFDADDDGHLQALEAGSDGPVTGDFRALVDGRIRRAFGGLDSVSIGKVCRLMSACRLRLRF